MSERDKWDGVDRRQRQRWRIKREISAGEVLAILGIAAGAAGAVYEMRSQLVALNDAMIESKAERAETRAELRRLNEKIDALILRAPQR